MRKYTYKYVKGYFGEQGCELMEEEYIDARIKMKYRCSCGNVSKISFSNFSKGKRCMKCGAKKRAIQKTYTTEQVKQYFKDHGCKLLEKEYNGCFQRLKYKCSCRNISKICFSSFKQGHRCQKCAGNETLTFEYIKSFFKQHGCKLLEKEYKNNHTKMKYICNCGVMSEIQFSNFKAGQRCLKCSESGYSKESQKLFNAIYKNLNNRYKNRTYYAILNKEFGIKYKNKCFKYDYVNSKFKKVIEYNGSVWHPIPSLKDTDTNWHAKDKDKTAKEARKHEKIKYEGLEKRGYNFLTIWDYEMKKDFNATVQRCLDFLTI